MWQPNAALPFFLASVLLLLLARQKRKNALLFASVFFFALAGAMHISVFAIAPVFYVILFLVIKEQGRGLLGTLFLAVLTFFGSIFLFYFPLAVYQSSLHGSLLLSSIFSPESYIRNFQNFVANLSANSVVFLKALAFGPQGWFLSFRVACMSLAGLIIPLYVYREKESQKKIFILSELGIFLSMVVLASVFPRSFDHWHFFPGLALAFIVIAEVIFALFSQFLSARVFRITFVFLLGIGMASLPFFKPPHAFFQKSTLPFLRESISITKAMKGAILQIQKEDSFDTLHFFQLKVYDSYYSWGERYSAAYLAPLAKALDAKVTKIDDSALGGYAYVNGDEYVVLVCENFTEMAPCVDAFQKDNGQTYEFKGQIYFKPLRSIFVLQKKA